MPVDEGDAYRRLYQSGDDMDRGPRHQRSWPVPAWAAGRRSTGQRCIAPPDWLRDEWDADHGLDGYASGQTDGGSSSASALRTTSSRRPWSRRRTERSWMERPRLGWEHAVTERNAGPCTDCGACGYGCRVGAKRSGLRAHLAAAHAGGARVLWPTRPSSRWRSRAGPRRGSGAACDRRQAIRGGSSPSVPVRWWCAAGALRTPLILASSGVGHPELGANLRLHPATVVIGRMPDPVEMWLGPLQAARSLGLVQPGPAGRARRAGAGRGGFFIEAAAHPGLIASGFPWEGGDAGRRRGCARPASWYRSAPRCGTCPRGACGGADEVGRGSTISWWMPTRRTAARATVEAQPARAGGRRGRADRRRHPAGPVQRCTGHGGGVGRVPGPARASRLRAEPGHSSSRPTRWGRRAPAPMREPTHATRTGAFARKKRGDRSRACYVADGSLFPTAAGVNPMVTIMTLAERTFRAVMAD